MEDRHALVLEHDAERCADICRVEGLHGDVLVLPGCVRLEEDELRLVKAAEGLCAADVIAEDVAFCLCLVSADVRIEVVEVAVRREEVEVVKIRRFNGRIDGSRRVLEVVEYEQCAATRTRKPLFSR